MTNNLKPIMSKIELTEKTWNVITGCSKGFDKVVFHEEELENPFRWVKPSMVFVNTISDTFHEELSFKDINKIYDEMIAISNHTYQVLTKRPDRMVEFFSYLSDYYEDIHLFIHNIWHGVSVENRDALHRIDTLRKVPSKIRFISFEPLLEDLGKVDLTGIQWIIIGCESGTKRRHMRDEWAISLVRQAKKQGVAVFVKQILDYKSRLCKEIEMFPDELQIREYPL